MPEYIHWPSVSRQLFLASGWAGLLLLGRQFWYATESVGAVGAAFFIDWFVGRYLFLTWNLFLGWIPFLLMLVLAWLTPQRRFTWAAWPLWGLWFLFLPNAPYLLTDFIHLRPRPPVPMWYDAGLLFTFAVIGWALGLASLRLAEGVIRERFGLRPARLFVPAVLAACAFGVAFGRILRWNSWDIVVHPRAISRDIGRLVLHPYDHLEYWSMTLVLFGMLLVSYCLFRSRPERLRLPG